MTTSYDYLLEGAPIDYFVGTLTKEQLLSSYVIDHYDTGLNWFMEFAKILDYNNKFINDIVSWHSKEEPHTIKYFVIPNFDEEDFEICAVAKIGNNGTTFILTNNKIFAESIKRYNVNVPTLFKVYISDLPGAEPEITPVK